MIANARYQWRRLERLGELKLATARAEEVLPWMSRLFELHRARWRMLSQEGVLASPDVQAFHLEVATRFHEAGMLRLHALALNGEPVALFYGLAARGRCHFYLSGFDPAYAASSPGTLLLYSVLEECRRRGDRVFDFLRGAEPYKYAWGARDETLLGARLRVAQENASASEVWR